MSRVSYPVIGAQTANERSRGLPLAGEVMRWLFDGEGTLTHSPVNRRRLGQNVRESAIPDMQPLSRRVPSRAARSARCSPDMSNRHARQPPKDRTITLADRRRRGISLGKADEI